MNTQHTVTEDEVGTRLDKLLTARIEHVSRHYVQQLIKNKHVTVNGVVKKANYLCRLHDMISWTFPQEKEREKIQAESVDLAIIYEDASIIVIDKPKQMIMHPTDTIRSQTLVNALLAYTDELSTLDGDERPGIVHRLDQDTSGLVLIAKNDEAHQYLKKQFQKQKIKRVYEAIVSGEVQTKKGTIDAPIGRNKQNRLLRTVRPDGREAITHYRVLEYLQDATILECALQTGRTHQIRVHMQYIGHPIIGDKNYGRNSLHAGNNGQALYAKKIGFYHPDTEEWMEFTTGRPTSFEKLIQRLK